MSSNYTIIWEMRDKYHLRFASRRIHGGDVSYLRLDTERGLRDARGVLEAAHHGAPERWEA
jgi:hypothetical protein